MRSVSVDMAGLVIFTIAFVSVSCTRGTEGELPTAPGSSRATEPDFLTRRELFDLSRQIIKVSDVGQEETLRRDFAVMTITVNNTTNRTIPREGTYQCLVFDTASKLLGKTSESRVDVDLNPGESKSGVTLTQIEKGAAVAAVDCRFLP